MFNLLQSRKPFAWLRNATNLTEFKLRQQALYTMFPLAALSILISVGTLAYVSYRAATRIVLDQMRRDAENVAASFPFFIQTGRTLLINLADELAQDQEPAQWQQTLADGVTTAPFFDQITFVARDGNVLPSSPDIPKPSEQESQRAALAITSDMPSEITWYENPTTGNAALSFIIPVKDSQTGESIGALIGRSFLDNNPAVDPVLSLLQERIIGDGEGFIVDDTGSIILYPAHPELQQSAFTLDHAKPYIIPGYINAFRQTAQHGERQLLYLLPISGFTELSVVIVVPQKVAADLAFQIAFPTLIILIALNTVIVAALLWLMHRITLPLDSLVKSAEMIRDGQLDRPVHVQGSSEIKELGNSFEEMRLRLKRRLVEMERLLTVSRNVSSSLQLFRAIPPILSSVLDITEASGVRIVLKGSASRNLHSYAGGDIAAAMAALDATLLDLTEQQGALVVSQISRTTGIIDIKTVPPRIQAFAAFPLRSEQAFLGILWLAYESEHIFEESELAFLSALSLQSAVAIANARLFAIASERSRELETVLASTRDGMIVTDNDGRILLVNPAAEEYFDIHFETVHGKRASEVITIRELSDVLENLQAPAIEIELPVRNGKVLLANTSTMINGNTIMGRVAVLRDITTLKELDTIKTVFLRMVSHDLRSPLTYMRGYVSMIPLVGDLNERQVESLAKITSGIEHIAQMTMRLTHLSRLQFGQEVELELALVDVDETVREVAKELETQRKQKDITLHIEIEEKLPFLLADAMLYRQAISNLVINGIKYTPEGGTVRVRAHKGSDTLTVSVIDTGPGIREEDQERLFEAFYRVPQREGDPPRPTGSGLGLALVRAIAEAHEGTVKCQSEFGSGSTFSLTLPIRKPTLAS